MKVKGLNGRDYQLDLKKYTVKAYDNRKRSIPHLKARELLEEFFNGYYVYEEVKLPGSTNPSKKSVLFLDFFIPNVMLGVEVHGSQHYEHCRFFHKSVLEYYEARYRDSLKAEWCELNNINLIVFDAREDVKIWRQQLECF